MKAKYIGKSYDKQFVYLEYEYRGKRYTVYENRAKGNEPLSWQHKSEQARIDRILDTPMGNGKAFDLDEIWEMLEW